MKLNSLAKSTKKKEEGRTTNNFLSTSNNSNRGRRRRWLWLWVAWMMRIRMVMINIVSVRPIENTRAFERYNNIIVTGSDGERRRDELVFRRRLTRCCGMRAPNPTRLDEEHPEPAAVRVTSMNFVKGRPDRESTKSHGLHDDDDETNDTSFDAPTASIHPNPS